MKTFGQFNEERLRPEVKKLNGLRFDASKLRSKPPYNFYVVAADNDTVVIAPDDGAKYPMGPSISTSDFLEFLKNGTVKPEMLK